MKTLLPLVVVAALTACAEPGLVLVESFAVPELASHPAQGATAAPGGGLDLLVSGVGLVRVDGAGGPVLTRRFGHEGLEERPYTDVAAVDVDRYVLLAHSEGALYDAVTGSLTSYFCVLPEVVLGPLVTQVNEAVAVDVEGGTIFAAPRFYEDEQLTEVSLRTYSTTDGAPQRTVDITRLGLEITGLAVDDEHVYAAAGRALHVFARGDLARDGAGDDVRPVVYPLEGAGAASGLALAGDRLSVTSADDDTVRIYDVGPIR